MLEQEVSPGIREAAKQLGHIGGAFAKLGEEALAAMQKRQAEEELEASLPPVADIYTMRPTGSSQKKNKLFVCHLCDDHGAVMIPMRVLTAWGPQRHLVAFGCDCGGGGQIMTYADHFGMPYRHGPEYAEIERKAKEGAA